MIGWFSWFLRSEGWFNRLIVPEGSFDQENVPVSGGAPPALNCSLAATEVIDTLAFGCGE